MRNNLDHQSERNRRSQVIRLGFTLCVLLVFLEGEVRMRKNAASDSTKLIDKSTTTTQQHNLLELQHFLNRSYTLPKITVNVSGSYYGRLNLDSSKAVDSNSNRNNRNKRDEYDFNPFVVNTNNNNNNQLFVLQLKTNNDVFEEKVHGLTYVYGYVKILITPTTNSKAKSSSGSLMSGMLPPSSASPQQIMIPMQGFMIKSSITLLATRDESQLLYLKYYNKDHNHHSTRRNRQKRRRKLQHSSAQSTSIKERTTTKLPTGNSPDTNCIIQKAQVTDFIPALSPFRIIQINNNNSYNSRNNLESSNRKIKGKTSVLNNSISHSNNINNTNNQLPIPYYFERLLLPNLSVLLTNTPILSNNNISNQQQQHYYSTLLIHSAPFHKFLKTQLLSLYSTSTSTSSSKTTDSSSSSSSSSQTRNDGENDNSDKYDDKFLCSSVNVNQFAHSNKSSNTNNIIDYFSFCPLSLTMTSTSDGADANKNHRAAYFKDHSRYLSGSFSTYSSNSYIYSNGNSNSNSGESSSSSSHSSASFYMTVVSGNAGADSFGSESNINNSSATAYSNSYINNGSDSNSNNNSSIDYVTVDNNNNGQYNYLNITFANVYMKKLKIEQKATIYGLLLCGIAIIRMYLLIIQIRHIQSEASVTKLSILSFSLQAVLDAVIAVAHFIFVPFVSKDGDNQSSTFLFVFILYLLIFGILEMRIIMSIFRARYAQVINERGARELEQRLLALNIRFLACFLFAFGLLLLCFTRPILIVLVFYSHWVPQIIWSAISGTRRSLHPYYLYGTAFLRLYLPLYFLLCPENLLYEMIADSLLYTEYKQTSTVAGYFFIVYTLFQVGVITLQDFYGPRFFLPASFFPHAYDYYRPVSILENMSTSTSTSSPSSSHHQDRNSNSSHNNTSSTAAAVAMINTFASSIIPTSSSMTIDVESNTNNNSSSVSRECAICFCDIESTTRGSYMITPCEHIFHTACLQQWLEIKLECPVCRTTLPLHEQ